MREADPQSRHGSPTPQEIETYLWDFIETSQALDEAHDLADAAGAVLDAGTAAEGTAAAGGAAAAAAVEGGAMPPPAVPPPSR